MSVSVPKIPGVVTIRYVVMSTLNRLQDYSLKKYKFLAQIAIEGYTEDLVPFHIGAGVEVVYLKMSTAKTVDLPSDFVNYNKIGVPINGKLRVITRNDAILLPRTFSNTLIQTAAQFVTEHAAAYLVGGVVVTSSGTAVIFTAAVAGVDFAGATTITNTSGNLTGTVVNTTPSGPGVKRVDTLTLSGTYGTANVLCDAVTETATFDSGETVGNTDSDEETEGLSNAIFFSDHFRNGQFIGGLYGLPGGIDTAYYRIDYENRQIVFSGTVDRSEIVLEYVTSGLKSDGSSLIPRQVIPALRSYIMWQMIENDKRFTNNEKQRKKDLYEEDVSALRSLENSFTKDEYLRMVYGASGQHAKR